MFIYYDEVLSVLAAMQRTLNEITDSLETFGGAVTKYNLTIQDATATEATSIVNSLRDHILHMQELITVSASKVEEATRGLAKIENNSLNGGLSV